MTLGLGAHRGLETQRDITECVKPRMPKTKQLQLLHLDHKPYSDIAPAGRFKVKVLVKPNRPSA